MHKTAGYPERRLSSTPQSRPNASLFYSILIVSFEIRASDSVFDIPYPRNYVMYVQRVLLCAWYVYLMSMSAKQAISLPKETYAMWSEHRAPRLGASEKRPRLRVVAKAVDVRIPARTQLWLRRSHSSRWGCVEDFENPVSSGQRLRFRSLWRICVGGHRRLSGTAPDRILPSQAVVLPAK
jgi:hypothetical protein